MPELPEVETVRRTLEPHVVGAVIREASFSSPLVLRHCHEPLPERLKGRRIERLERRGKFLLFHLDEGILTIHLGMTGKLLIGERSSPHTRAVFDLGNTSLVYDDIRMFGSIEWTPVTPQRIERLGPEPFEVSPQDFLARLRQHKAPIKNLLLNQAFVRGLGNIYVDESLFRSAIRPTRRACTLSSPRALRLLEAIQQTLLSAIRAGGSSISDYVDADNRRGAFQDQHQVYGREGLPCVACGTPIRRIVLGQRGTHYCPKCQK